MPRDEARRDQRRHEQRAGEARERQRRIERLHAEPSLQVDREDQEQRAAAEEVHRDHREAAAERAQAEELEVDQWILPVRRGAPFLAEEPPQDRHRRDQHHDRPRRPAGLVALDQRHEQQREARGRDRDAEEIECRRIRRARLGQRARGDPQRDATDRQVDQEQDAPAEVEPVPVHQQAAEQLSRDRSQRDVEPEVGQRLGPLVLGKGDLDQRQHLREGQRRRESLQETRSDQEPRIGREAAQERSEHEARQADQEHLAPAVRVPEPTAGDDEHGVAERVDRDHRLLLRERRSELLADLRQRQVDDEEVEHAEEGGRQCREEPDPAARIGSGMGLRRKRGAGGHPLTVARARRALCGQLQACGPARATAC